MGIVGRFDYNGFHSAFNSTLINGKGRYPGGPADVPLAVVNVKQGKRSVFMCILCLGMV
jgi:hypothetical protein